MFGKITLEYKIDEKGLLHWEGETFMRDLFIAKAPTVEMLRRKLQPEFPRWFIELRPL